MSSALQLFLSSYPKTTGKRVFLLREVILKLVPEVSEQIDYPAKMIAYCYGQQYKQMVCTLIPSQKGLKLGFAYGVDLPDPQKLLQGTGKISRYVEITSDKQISSKGMKDLLESAYKAYCERCLESEL